MGAGETAVITDRDKPIAQTVPIQASNWGVRVDEWVKMRLATLPLSGPLIAGEIHPLELSSGGYAGALDALLEGRAENR